MALKTITWRRIALLATTTLLSIAGRYFNIILHMICNEQEDEIIHTVGQNSSGCNSTFLLSLLEHRRKNIESPRLLGSTFRRRVI